MSAGARGGGSTDAESRAGLHPGRARGRRVRDLGDPRRGLRMPPRRPHGPGRPPDPPRGGPVRAGCPGPTDRGPARGVPPERGHRVRGDGPRYRRRRGGQHRLRDPELEPARARRGRLHGGELVRGPELRDAGACPLEAPRPHAGPRASRRRLQGGDRIGHRILPRRVLGWLHVVRRVGERRGEGPHGLHRGRGLELDRASRGGSHHSRLRPEAGGPASARGRGARLAGCGEGRPREEERSAAPRAGAEAARPGPRRLPRARRPHGEAGEAAAPADIPHRRPPEPRRDLRRDRVPVLGRGRRYVLELLRGIGVLQGIEHLVVREPTVGGRSLMTRRGSALIAVLWSFTILSIVILSAVRATTLELRVARNWSDIEEARWLALAGVERAKAAIHESRRSLRAAAKSHDPALASDAGAFRDVLLGNGIYRVIRSPGPSEAGSQVLFGVRDEESRLDVNRASVADLQKLPGMTASIAAAIVDWRDDDDTPRPGGAEREEYASLEPPSEPRNGPYETLR